MFWLVKCAATCSKLKRNLKQFGMDSINYSSSKTIVAKAVVTNGSPPGLDQVVSKDRCFDLDSILSVTSQNVKDTCTHGLQYALQIKPRSTNSDNIKSRIDVQIHPIQEYVHNINWLARQLQQVASYETDRTLARLNIGDFDAVVTWCPCCIGR